MSSERRVLVVEDEFAIRTLLCEMLADEGYVVRAAANGADGLAVIESFRPDVIVLDLSMPILDGRGFLDAQRRRADIASIPVIVISAENQLRGLRNRLAVAAVLTKPFDVDVLLARIAEAVGPTPAGLRRTAAVAIAPRRTSAHSDR